MFKNALGHFKMPLAPLIPSEQALNTAPENRAGVHYARKASQKIKSSKIFLAALVPT